MHLRFLGVGAAFAPEFGNTGAFFIRGDDLFLIDCGEQAFDKLMRSGVLPECPGEVTVVLTHMHSDHCGSLGSLCLYVAERMGRQVTIVHPNEDVRELLAMMGVADNQYSLKSAYEAGGLRISPMPTRHVPLIPAFSYLLEDEKGGVYYSGDTCELPPQVLYELRGGKIRHAYQEAMYLERPPEKGVPHLLYSDLLSMVEHPLRERMTLMHFNVDFRRLAQRDGFQTAYMDPIFSDDREDV
ncbi:MBL fold metallo-hydrolase [Eubacteriales bacterium OttesenSCG-928-A19]|nr:MBL fold metallo-hydrolase [Eubacteriales bacterium OttesenSCG-928-A19]